MTEEIVNNEIQDEERLVEQFIQDKQIIRQLEMSKGHINPNDNFIPSTPVESAKSLLDKTSTTEEIKQVDKEHKLGNFDKKDEESIFLHTELWDTVQYLKEKALKRELEASIKFGWVDEEGKETNIPDEIRLQKYLKQAMKDKGHVQRLEHQDESGAFNKSFFISSLTKGRKGWERGMQNTTISHHTIGKGDKSEEKPSVLQRMTGRN